MGFKVHEREIVAKEAIVDYAEFNETRIIVDRRVDDIMITAVSRTGDINVFRWYPSYDKLSGELWRYRVKTAYDETNVTFGVYHGDYANAPDDENALDQVLCDIVDYDGSAITPKDADGFIRLRLRRGSKRSMGVVPYLDGDDRIRRGFTIDSHPAKSAKVKMRVNNVLDGDEIANGLVTFIHIMGERVETVYTDYDTPFDHMFSPFDYEEFPGQLNKGAVDTIGDRVDEMLDEVSKPMDLNRKLSTAIYGYIVSLFVRRKGYEGIRPYNRKTFNAIFAV